MKRLALLLLSAVLAACYGGTDATDRPPANLELRSGDRQAATVGTTLPAELVVRVLDRRGRPVEGEPVSFVPAVGSGSVEAASVVTGRDGTARTRWTLGESARDTQRVAVAASRGQGGAIPTAEFRAVAVPDVPSVVAAVGTTLLVGAVGESLDSLGVVVTDRFGNPIPGAPVAWSVPAGGGTVSPAVAQTGADGVARARWTLGPRLDTTHVAEAAAGLTLRTRFTATPRLPLGVRIERVSGGGVTAPVATTLADSLVVRVTLADGTPAMGAPLRWESGTQSGTPSSIHTRTDATGRSAVAWTLGTRAGAATMTAVADPAITVLFTATQVPGPAERLESGGGSGQRGRAGTTLPQPLRVRARDAHGNAVAGVPVRWTVRGGGGSVSPAEGVTAANGEMEVRWTLGGAESQSVRAQSPSLGSLDYTAQRYDGPRVSVQVPSSGTVVGDTVVLAATATGLSPILAMTAEAGGRSAALVRQDLRFRGALVLRGLAEGAVQLTVRAVEADGDTGTLVVPLTYRRLPRLLVETPFHGAVVPADTRVAARCIGADGGACTVSVTRVEGGGFRIAEGAGSVDATTSLAAFEGDSLTLRFEARDGAGRVAAALHRVRVESSPRLREVDAGGIQAMGIDEARILFHDLHEGDTALFLRNRTSGVLWMAGPQFVRGSERITPQGVLFQNAFNGWITEFSQGLTHPRGPAQAGSVRTAGRSALWRAPDGTLMLLNLGSTPLPLDAVPAGEYDLASDNSIVVQRGGAILHLGPGSIITRLAGGVPGNTVGPSARPRTDGRTVTFLRAGGVLARATFGGVEDTVATGVVHGEGAWMNEGWIAYRKTGGGAPQVWTRGPDGVERQVSPGPREAEIEYLGPGGEVVFTSAGRRYAVRAPYAAPVDIGAAWGDARFFRVNGALLMTMGREALEVGF